MIKGYKNLSFWDCADKYKRSRYFINIMRKIIVLSFITLDGVMQAPGGPEEDESGAFKYGLSNGSG